MGRDGEKASYEDVSTCATDVVKFLMEDKSISPLLQTSL